MKMRISRKNDVTLRTVTNEGQPKTGFHCTIKIGLKRQMRKDLSKKTVRVRIPEVKVAHVWNIWSTK
jgi:hypothetical protein